MCVGNKIANQRTFTDCMVDGVHCGPDGHRVDVARQCLVGLDLGAGLYGRDGVESGRQVHRPHPPAGDLRQPLFCGPKRDWLWMCASQSVYLVRLGIQGAATG